MKAKRAKNERKPKVERREDWVRKYVNGWTFEEIARESGVTKQWVFQVLAHEVEWMELRCLKGLTAALDAEVTRRQALGQASNRNQLVIELLGTAFDQGLHLYPPNEGR